MEGSAKEKQEALDKRYIRMASIWAENSYCKRRQVGALIVKDKMIILTGTTERLPVLKMYVKTIITLPNLTCCMPRRMQSRR